MKGGSSARTLPSSHLEASFYQERGAKQRGNVAHTARPGKPEGPIVNSLIEVRDESTRSMQEAEVWEEVEMIVGSGASGTVVGEDMVKAVEAVNVKNDIFFKMADGSRTPHMGENTFKAYTDQGHLRHMTAAVTEVDDALLSVSKVVKAGNRVVFDDSGSCIEHKVTGEVTPLFEQRGFYKLKIGVPKEQSGPF